jgi:hypothetical protein
MGDQSLMKKTLYFLAISLSFLYADLTKEQIREMVQHIHQKRVGVKLETLEQTKEPFIRLVENNESVKIITPKASEEVKLSLHAIMNGKAYINDSWKKKGDSVMGYELVYIGKNGVVLKNENQIKKLFLHKKKNDLILMKERD